MIVIECLAIDRQAAVAGFGKYLDEMLEGGLFLDCDDVGARHADIAGVALPEVEQVADHLAFERGQIAFLVGGGVVLVLLDRFFERARSESSVSPNSIERSARQTLGLSLDRESRGRAAHFVGHFGGQSSIG